LAPAVGKPHDRIGPRTDGGRRTDALPCFRHRVFACGQMASMQYERIEMFAELAIRKVMKNIFASPPFGGGGTAPKGVSKSEQ